MIAIQPLPATYNALGYYAVGCHSKQRFGAALRAQQGIALHQQSQVVVLWDTALERVVTVWIWWRW